MLTQAGLKHRGTWKKTLAILAVLAVTAGISMVPAPSPASAETIYTEAYGGCTYSWGAPCYIWLGAMNYILTMDPDHASAQMQEDPTFNGYPKPKYDGKERDVCANVFEYPGVPYYGWTCNWGEVVTTYPPTWGYSAIGTGEEYYNIALYDDAGYAGF